MSREEIEVIKSGIETIRKIMKLQNEIFTRKIKQLEESISKGNQNELNLLEIVIEILAEKKLLNISPELIDKIREIKNKAKEEYKRSIENIIFNKDEFKLDMDDLTKLYQDLDDLLDF